MKSIQCDPLNPTKLQAQVLFGSSDVHRSNMRPSECMPAQFPLSICGSKQANSFQRMQHASDVSTVKFRPPLDCRVNILARRAVLCQLTSHHEAYTLAAKLQCSRTGTPIAHQTSEPARRTCPSTRELWRDTVTGEAAICQRRRIQRRYRRRMFHEGNQESSENCHWPAQHVWDTVTCHVAVRRSESAKKRRRTDAFRASKYPESDHSAPAPLFVRGRKGNVPFWKVAPDCAV
ncbi:hypothetical protein C8R47DRAFT_119538 [Mycena vitilis]|nr:hypothetical protein C8R47DRAFT_119538 [Mycena vitilis]